MIKEIQIENLKCHGCANTIIKELSEIKGVDTVAVDVENSTVKVNTSDTILITIKEKLSKLGYPETGDANNLMHKAKSYVSCAIGRINK